MGYVEMAMEGMIINKVYQFRVYPNIKHVNNLIEQDYRHV